MLYIYCATYYTIVYKKINVVIFDFIGIKDDKASLMELLEQHHLRHGGIE